MNTKPLSIAAAVLAAALLGSYGAPSAAGSDYAAMLSSLPEKTKAAYSALVKGKSDEERHAIEDAAVAHSDPAIRVLPHQSMTWNFCTGPADSPRFQHFIAQLTKEQDLKVLTAGLKSMMNDLKCSPELYEFYKKSAAHENAEVRQAAMQGLINKNNKDAAGIEAEAVKFLDDPDEKIRARACKELLRAGNSLALPKVEVMMKGADAGQEEVLGGCAEGLLNQWYYAPFFKEFDAKAYQLTLDYLNKTPRSKNLPVWQVLGTLGKAPKDEWKALAKEYKAKDVTAALAAVAKDAGASKQAREYAIKAIAVHGTKADLEALAKALGDDPVAKEVEKTLQKLNS